MRGRVDLVDVGAMGVTMRVRGADDMPMAPSTRAVSIQVFDEGLEVDAAMRDASLAAVRTAMRVGAGRLQIIVSPFSDQDGWLTCWLIFTRARALLEAGLSGFSENTLAGEVLDRIADDVAGAARDELVRHGVEIEKGRE